MQKEAQPSLFDIEAIVAENQKVVEEKESLQRESYYEKIKLPYFDSPQNDNERMFNLQYRFLKNNDKSAREELFKLGYDVLFRLLWAEMKKKQMSYLDKEQQGDIVANAFIYVFRRYERGTGYAVEKNFICVLRDGIRHALKYKTMSAEEESLDAIQKDYTNRILRVF